MKIEHKEIKKSATEATRLIENYWKDYNKISDELKPEIIGERRADLANEFSKNIVEHISRLKAGVDQLEQERAQMTDPERRLILDALNEAPKMTAGEVFLAQSFAKLPHKHLGAVAEMLNAQDASAPIKLAFLQAMSNNAIEERRAAQAILDGVELNAEEARWIAALEKLAREVILKYEERPGTMRSATGRMRHGRAIRELDKAV